MGTDAEMTQLLDLTGTNFKTAIVTMLMDQKEICSQWMKSEWRNKTIKKKKKEILGLTGIILEIKMNLDLAEVFLWRRERAKIEKN